MHKSGRQCKTASFCAQRQIIHFNNAVFTPDGCGGVGPADILLGSPCAAVHFTSIDPASAGRCDQLYRADNFENFRGKQQVRLFLSIAFRHFFFPCCMYADRDTFVSKTMRVCIMFTAHLPTACVYLYLKVLNISNPHTNQCVYLDIRVFVNRTQMRGTSLRTLTSLHSFMKPLQEHIHAWARVHADTQLSSLKTHAICGTML